MADAAVEFLLENLKQLLLHYRDLIANVKPQVEKLDKDLRLLNAFLKDTTKKRRKDERMRELIRQIQDVVYEAEDVVDMFVTQASEVNSRSYFHKMIKKPLNLLEVAKMVEDVSSKVVEIYGDKSKLDFALLSVADGGGDPQDENEAPIIRQENIVGFEDEADTLIGYLKEETEQLDVVSIIGMPGLGKTTLAGMIYRSSEIQFGFTIRIWVYISQEFTRKNVLLAILKELTNVSDDMRNKTDQELAQKVSAYLQNEKFLIVMDDVWTAEDWDTLKVALPTSNKMGKVLITSRNMEVGRYASRTRTPHSLRFLTAEESWLLFQYEVFGKLEFPTELEPYGRSIIKKCDNLPLAIVVIGGILAKKVSATEDIVTLRNTWRKVSENVNMLIVDEDSTKRMEKIIALSYDKLPHHLRACFLYLGMFPEDFEIPARKLNRLWIAEGFILRKTGISLEDTAESYLDELINRNLLRVDKRRRDGMVKTCRTHDMIRDFCRTEAGHERENLLQEIKMSREGSFDPPVADIPKFRRLCIHSNVTNFVSSKLYGPRVRSFAYFSTEEINLPVESISAAFKLLRVLEVQVITFSKIPKDMYQLFHLRYIAISVDLDILPAAFSKLWNIQTLIVDTKERTLEVKANIWKMKHLRHFKTNASATLPKIDKHSVEGGNTQTLQTLGTISPQCCTQVVLGRACYLKKLGIRGRLALLLGPKNGSFDSLERLVNLEKLKLINDVFPGSSSDDPLPSLPRANKFPRNLRSLTLSDTLLDWCHMSVIGLLENLEVLKLKDKAFMGDTWKALDGCFRKLEVLCIGRTNLVTWIALKHHFPKLRSLELKNCEELQQVPIELADIQSFLMLDLQRATKSAAASAKNIRDKKKQMKEGQTTKFSGFKLSIFPPDE